MNNPNTDTSFAAPQQLTLTQEWDKTFPKSDKVDHHKVTFVNRYGITLAADATHVDLYDNLDKTPFNRIATFFNTWMPAK